MSYGALPDSWLNFDFLGLTEDLLPVVSNPNVPISPNSKLKQIGKVPSKFDAELRIVGISNWTMKRSTPQDIERWSKEADFGICLQTRTVRALDVDVTDPEKAWAIKEFLNACFSESFPCRSRSNSPKFLLAFTLKGEFSKRMMKVEGGIIEFLATGQQFVACGTHPSGARYEGLDDVSGFPEVTKEQFETLWSALTERFAIEAPSEGRLRNALTAEGFAKLDDVGQFLETEGHATGYGKEGQIFIHCPFEHEHSEPSPEYDTSTAYLPAGGRDYQQGHFACLHAHCADRPDEDFLDAFGYRLKDFDAIPDTPEDVKKRDRFTPIDGDDFSEYPAVNWLIKGILPEKGSYQFYGGSGDGKTFAVLDMMLALCRGVDWNGHKTVKKGVVVYICAEGRGGFISRLKAYKKAHNLDRIPEGFWVIPDTPNFRTMEDVKAVATKINALGVPVDVVVTDTLAQVSAGADENSVKDMSLVLKHFDALKELTDSAGGIVHHSGKNVERGARGTSALKAPLDAQFCISRTEEGRKFWVDKMKDGRDGFGYEFDLKSIAYDHDKDGDIIDSCIVVSGTRA